MQLISFRSSLRSFISGYRYYRMIRLRDKKSYPASVEVDS